MKKYLCVSFITVSALLPLNNLLAADTANVPSQEPTKKEITEHEAKTIALKLVPGKVREVEKEKHKGELVYSVEITVDGGEKHEVIINRLTGAVIEDQTKSSGDHDDEDEEDEEEND